MAKSNPTDTLNTNISLLEQKRNKDFIDLKYQLKLTGESMKPSNLIKGAVRDIAGSHQLRSILVKAAIGIALGYIANRIVTGQRRSLGKNIKKRLIGNALQYGISFLASKRNNLLKAAGVYAANQIIELIRQRRLQKRHLDNGEPLAESAQVL